MRDILFDDPEFYDIGNCATICNDLNNKVYILSEGDRCLTSKNGFKIIKAIDFRKHFPNGILPSQGSQWTWMYNGWFKICTEKEILNNLEGEITYSMSEAIYIALNMLNEMESSNNDS